MIQHTPLQEPRHASNPACRDRGAPPPHGITDYLRQRAKLADMGSQLMAIVVESKNQRYFLPSNVIHEMAAAVARPEDVPDVEIPHNPRYLTAPNYGMRTWADLFTNRQLTNLTTFSGLVAEARERILADSPNKSYADAVSTYLSFGVDKLADTNSTLCTWQTNPPRMRATFSRQAVQMSWDFAESCPFGRAAGDYALCIAALTEVLDRLPKAKIPGKVCQINATSLPIEDSSAYATDPPYYDNVGYSDLSDFFYSWLRRSLSSIYPDLLATMMTPKADELVADPIRQGGKKQAEEFFEHGFTDFFKRICRQTSNGPMTVFYAFKQSETDREGAHASTGWETLLEGMLRAGWVVTATWPIRSERG